MSRSLRVLMRLVLLPLVLIPGFGSMAFADPGDVTVDKTVVPVGDCRTYEVTLSASAEPGEKPIDVILVIDRSGTMGYGSDPTSLDHAKDAANALAAQVLADTANRVGVVSYGSSASLDQALTGTLSAVQSAIDDLNDGGYTNIEDGFLTARDHMAAAGRNPSLTSRAIVLLSDGVANREADGGFCTTYPTSHTACTIAAYLAGQSAQAQAHVFTVGLMGYIHGSYPSSEAVAIETLQLAEDAGYFQTYAAADLNDIYLDITGQLNPGAVNVAVTDPVAAGFSIVSGSLAASQGTVSTVGNTIGWEVGAVGTTEVTLTYRVTASGANTGQELAVNNGAVMNYINYLGAPAQAFFPNPTVCVQPPDPVASFTWEETEWKTYQFTDTSVPGAATGCAAGGGCALGSWHWDFGDGNTSTQQHPLHTYASAGGHTVVLTVTCACGCEDVHSVQPTSVSVVSFGASQSGVHVVVAWETASEIDNVGFNLLRAGSEGGTRTKLNAELIPTKAPPGSPVGATYEFVDDTVEPGVEYDYWLEAVDVSGQVEVYGPARAGLLTYEIDKNLLERPIDAPVGNE